MSHIQFESAISQALLGLQQGEDASLETPSEAPPDPKPILDAMAEQAAALQSAADQWRQFSGDAACAVLATALDSAAAKLGAAAGALFVASAARLEAMKHASALMQAAIEDGAVAAVAPGRTAGARLRSKAGKAGKAARSKASAKAKAGVKKVRRAAGAVKSKASDAVSSVKAKAGTVEGRVMQYKDEILAAARKHGVPPAMIAAVIEKESGGVKGARSFDGGHGKGLMQIDDRFHALARSARVFDPAANIDYGAKLLAQNLKAFKGNERAAIAAYNAGIGGVQGALKRGQDPSSVTYAKGYVSGIQGAMGKYDRYF